MDAIKYVCVSVSSGESYQRMTYYTCHSDTDAHHYVCAGVSADYFSE
jgi:hypothetical protein